MDLETDPPPLSQAQLEILEVIWERGEATLGEVWKALSRRRTVARNTIQTLLTRLVEKGWLHARMEGKTFHYSAVHPREPTLRGLARRLVDTVFQGSTEGMIMALLDDQEISAEEAGRIRAIIERAERRQS
jgi:predicted transcriptional regulator